MRAVVHPSRIGVAGMPAQYNPPPSKSHFQRLCAAALLSYTGTTIVNPGRSEDDAAALRIIRDLGAEVSPFRDGVFRDGAVYISGGFISAINGRFQCGESGLAARLFAPIAALADEPIEIHGDGSLLKRPMHDVVDALRSLGVQVENFSGTLPFTVRGPLQPRSISVDGSRSSQTVSGILFALATSAAEALAGTGAEPITLRVRSLVSKPYFELSCAVLREFGHHVSFDGHEICTIAASNYDPEDVTIRTEEDWSSIAPVAVAASFAGQVEFKAKLSSYQADSIVLTILRDAGARVVEKSHGLYRISSADLRAFEADCTHSPDLVPILAILATACKGQSRISGLYRLTHKESDRTKTTSALLTSLAIKHRIDGDAFIITGPQTPLSATVDGHNDHRIVMAAAIAALRANGPVTIEGAEAVRKSYPDFFDDLQKLGVQVELTP